LIVHVTSSSLVRQTLKHNAPNSIPIRPVLEYIIIITTIKRTSVGDAAYARSHGAAVHTAAGCRAC